MMDGNYVELEAHVMGHQRRLRAAADAERRLRAARPEAGRPGGPTRRVRSALAAGLVTVAAWLDDRYADRGALPGSWVRIA